MSDISAPTSTLQASGSELMAPDPMSVDASAIDRNLRAIRQVQSGWRLPELPDEVILDLAGQPMDHRGISDFLSGLERDAFNENPEDFTAPATPQLSVVSNMGEYGPLAVDGFTRAMSTINSLRGMSPVEVLDADATQRWKLRAIDQGFLTAPEDGVVDSSWSPELGAIQRQMQYSEFNDKMRGDRPGAMPFGRAMGILADWTSPSGLMRAAVDLDLFWDTGQIGREIDSWGDKWRKVGDSKNPLDFGKNLFDALTGPIDDIVVPALNMALLFTGVGHATNFARLAITGTSAVKAAETVTFMNRLYELPKVGTLIGKIFPAADAAGLAKASWTAEKFMGSSRPLLQAAGSRMAAWRELPTVIGTRGIVQQGMRLGIASQVENRLLPNYQGSGSLSDIPAVANLSERALGNAWVTGIGEVLFTPYTIFEPGTFINGGKSAVAGAFKYLGTTQGRMAAGAVIGAGVASVGDADGGDVLQGAAIGAGAAAAAPTVGRWMRDGMEVLEFGGHKVPLLSKAVKGVGKSLAHLNWEPIGNDQRMSQVFMDAMRAKLEPEAWAGFEQGIVKQGFLKTLADHVGTDTKGASAMMAYVAVSASIDRTAALQAGAAGSKGWYERYWLARNKLTAQLRTFDDTATREDVVWAIVSKSGGRRDIKKRFDRYMAQVEATPETFAEHLSNHNMSAQQTLRQLLQPDNLPVTALDDHYAGLTKYVANAMDSFGNWPKYQPLTESLGAHLNAGLFEEAMLAPAVSMLGTRAPIKVLEALPEYVPPMDESMVANWSSHLNDSLFLEQGVDVESWRRAGGYYNPLAAEIDPMRHKVTLMRTETPSKAEYLVAADELERTLKVTQAHLRAAKVTRKDGEAVIRIMDELDLSGLSAHQLSQTLKAAAVGEKDRQAFESVRQFVQHMKAQGVDTGRAFDLALNDFVNSLTQDARWTRYGQKTHLVDENQKVLGGMDALKARAKQLRQDARYTAAEIDTDDLVAKVAASKGQAAADDLKAYFDHASSQGYKVVYGADFLMPDELLNRTGMFADINERHMNAMTLGNFFGRRHPEELALNVQMARQRSIARQLGKIHGDVAPDDERVLTALDDVYHHVLDPELQRNSAMISDLRHQSMTERWGTALRTSKQPQSMQDLGLGSNRKRVTDKLVQMGWSEKEAGAVWQGLKEARYAEWRDMGLYAIEAKLRGRNQLLDALHVLGGTPNAKVLRTAAGGAATGAAYGVATGEDMEGILTDAAVGAIGRPLAGQITKRAEQAMDLTAWARYGYMADNLAALRDRLRFSLSPFFDMSRFTEAWMLGQTAAPRRAADGSRIALPLNQSPRALRRSLLAEGGEAFAEGKMKQISDEFMAASRGHFDPGELESTAKWFQSTGLLGFNPTAWMQSTFHHMRQAGLSPDEAYKNVREMYTYGTKARSAFEQSVNFVFFPFSFQKKSLGHLANFISDDLTRSVLIHDAYKAYEALDERYDLGVWAEDHLPVLKKLQQLNMFAFGISPGRLGGINAQAIEAFVGDPTSMDPEKRGLILNLFSPQGVNMASVGTEEFKKLVMKTVPIMNDVKWMINDLKSQGHVLFDPSHMTVAAQTREAYNEWNEYRKGVDAALKNVGASWYDLKNNPGLAPLWEDMQRHKTELEKRYPGWNESKLRGATNRADLAMEKEHRLNMVQFFPEEATLADYQFAQMEQTLDALKAIMGQYGITDWEDAPPSEYARVKGVAIEMVRQNRAFLMVWNKFYRNDFGDITSDVEV